VADNSILSVFGVKGSGKSTLVREIVAEHDRVIAIDTIGEYTDGFRIVEGLDACLDALDWAEGQERFKLSLRCGDPEDMLDLIGVSYEFPRTLVVVEETSFYCSPSQLPEELSKLVRYGRHREIDQIYVARRPSEIHRDLTAQSDVIVTFRHREPRDLDYLARMSGQDVSQVASLPDWGIAAWGDPRKMPLAVLARQKSLTATDD
jgi:DNA helicase HerA-like ATPase